MEKEININDLGADPKVYEIGFHIVPNLSEEAKEEEVSKIRSYISSVNGSIIADGAVKKMDLAYPIVQVASNKRATFNSSFFGWFKFEAEPKGAKEVASLLKADTSVIRFLLIKTVREDTMAPRKLLMKKKEDEVVEAPEVIVSEEEIDASIDKLIAE